MAMEMVPWMSMTFSMNRWFQGCYGECSRPREVTVLHDLPVETPELRLSQNFPDVLQPLHSTGVEAWSNKFDHVF